MKSRAHQSPFYPDPRMEDTGATGPIAR
jgi:hypothetical protein